MRMLWLSSAHTVPLSLPATSAPSDQPCPSHGLHSQYLASRPIADTRANVSARARHAALYGYARQILTSPRPPFVIEALPCCIESEPPSAIPYANDETSSRAQDLPHTNTSADAMHARLEINVPKSQLPRTPERYWGARTDLVRNHRPLRLALAPNACPPPVPARTAATALPFSHNTLVAREVGYTSAGMARYGTLSAAPCVHTSSPRKSHDRD
ncbi:hypothetical protein MSAN_01956700 [Mycena sanguinolenta]|uniref:Uncharacterized protein n=1 Tax=Mycena sanguinolenta TaxID=230812 RepID=A0A8H6XP03_9AGAR|nr:hypothetical protein MSAN_01956700 [Mycena sanguinolenta]